MTSSVAEHDQSTELSPDQLVSLAGFSTSTPLARRLVAARPEGLVQMPAVPMLAHFTVEEVELDFVGQRHVPSMRIEGRLSRLVPANPEVMPYGIGEILLAEDEAARVCGDYPFTTEQIQTLVDKGLYMEGFAPPADWVGAVFEVDAELDVNVLPPVASGAAPLVIVDCSPMAVFDMRQEVSRYELTQFFPDHRGALIEAGALTGKEALGPEMASGQLMDLRGFSFGDPQVEAEMHRGERDHAAKLSELTGVELSAPRALAALRMSTQSLASRAERVRQELRSPGGAKVDEFFAERVAGASGLGGVSGLAGLAGVTGLGQAGQASRDLDELTGGDQGRGDRDTSQELSEAVADLDLSGFEDMDLSDFSFGDESLDAALSQGDQSGQTTQAGGSSGRHRQPDEPEHDDGYGSQPDEVDPLGIDPDAEEELPPESDQSPAARARRARVAQRRAAQQATRRAQAGPSPLEQGLMQDLSEKTELPEGNTSSKKEQGPELG